MGARIKIPQCKKDNGCTNPSESTRSFASPDSQDQLVAVGPVFVDDSRCFLPQLQETSALREAEEIRTSLPE